MKDAMKIRIVLSVLLLMSTSTFYGQAIPAGTITPISSIGSGPNLPNLDGVVHYALSASEAIQFGYYGSGVVTNSAILSGDVGYTAKSELRPFSLLAAGGVILANQSGQGTTGFINGVISQGYITRNWNFNISDSVSFLPQSPTTGLSGIPGVGDLGSVPVTGPVEGPAGGIFSVSGNRVANSLTGSVERNIGRETSISGSGSWSLFHFLGDNASTVGLFDNSVVSGMVAINRRLDARSSMNVNAVYSTFSYTGSSTGLTQLINAGLAQPDIETRGINLSYQRLLTRSFSFNVSGGPQWVSSSNSTLIPSAINAAVSGGLSYSRGLTNASVGYSRGVNAGSGVLAGALTDTVYASVGHNYGRRWVAALSAGYTHSAGLTQLPGQPSQAPVNEVYDTTFGAAQLTHGFTPRFSGFVSYEAQHQSSNNAVARQNVLNGTSQTFAVGVTFTPRSTRLGQF
jgi:hypothetical protein